MEEPIIYLSPSDYVVGTNERGHVAINLRGIESALGLSEGLSVAAIFSPTEARALASALLRTADAAEARLSPH